jgi:hypothetical protein
VGGGDGYAFGAVRDVQAEGEGCQYKGTRAHQDSMEQKKCNGSEAARCQTYWIPHEAKHGSSIDFMFEDVNGARLALAR